jgi:sugar O-acyltransferase (sialic acid O-acetyltransferase NeuD family)
MVVNSQEDLIIVGAGGHGKVVADIAAALGYKNIVFVDARWPQLSQVLVWPVIAASIPDDFGDAHVAVAIGDNVARYETFTTLQERGASMPQLVHPFATVSRHARLGSGVVVAAGAVVAVNVHVGDACIVNTLASVDHDCILGSAVHVSPGAHLAGNVRVGNRSWIGMGSNVREGLEIGSDAVIGAGSAVISSVADHSRVGGVPARSLR